MDTIEALQPAAVIFILVGVTFLGGAIGSFLNVVIYRLPASQSLVHPPSRCPRCEHPIRPYDNIPVFGWLLLRGKCRDCGEPISARYPMIEAIVAAMFLVVVWVEWFGPRYGLWVTLSTSSGNVHGGPSTEMVVSMTAVHLIFLTTLLGVGMIEWDGHRVPRKIWIPVILVCIVYLVLFLNLTLWRAWDWGPMSTDKVGIFESLFGAGVGLAVGIFLSLFDWLRTEENKSLVKNESLPFATLCIGLIFGWQMIVLVGLVFLPILLIEIFCLRIGRLQKLLPHGLSLWGITLVSLVSARFWAPFFKCFW